MLDDAFVSHYLAGSLVEFLVVVADVDQDGNHNVERRETLYAHIKALINGIPELPIQCDTLSKRERLGHKAKHEL